MMNIQYNGRNITIPPFQQNRIVRELDKQQHPHYSVPNVLQIVLELDGQQTVMNQKVKSWALKESLDNYDTVGVVREAVNHIIINRTMIGFGEIFHSSFFN